MILAGEAPAHRNQFTLSGRLQPHDIGKVHRGGDDDLIRSILDDEGLGEGVNPLPGTLLGFPTSAGLLLLK